MDIRGIGKQVATLSVVSVKRGGRRLGIGAIVCGVLGASAFAQAQFEFIDPLDEERSRIEKAGDAPISSPEVPRAKPGSAGDGETSDLLTRARDGACASAAAAQEKATGFWARMRASMGEVADSLGLPTAGLLGLLGLLLAGIACLVGWTLFRGRRGSSTPMHKDDLYQNDASSRRRRKLGDVSPLSKDRDVRADDDFEETMPEDFDRIFRDEEDAAVAMPKPPTTMDTKQWRKPNLDRLRESIKVDWKADKAGKAGVAAGAAAAGAGAIAAGSSFDYRAVDPADMPLDEVSDGWEAWDTQVKPDDDVWGATLAPDADGEDNDAVQRIRALRESLKAS